jgi:S-adenosylmethionine hydrolase
MGRSQNSFIKNQKANKKKKKRQEKLQKKIDKKDQETSGKLDDMIAYVDEFGNIVDEKPEEPKKDNKSETNNK